MINIGLLIERIAGVAFNPSPRTPMSSSRRDTPRGGGLSRGGGGGAVVWASFFVRLHLASTPDSATARTRSHSAVARTGVSVHASSAGVYIITESRAVRSMPCFARWPRGPPARSSIPWNFFTNSECGTAKNGRASERTVARSRASIAPSPSASNAANVAPSIASGS